MNFLDNDSTTSLAAEPLNILLLDAGLSAARSEIQQLRERGLLIEHHILADQAELEAQLKQGLPDLVIYHYNNPADLDHLARLREHYPKLVLILIINPMNTSAMEAALEVDIQALVPLGNIAMLRLVLERERKLRNRIQQTQRLKQELAETQERYQGLIDHSQEPIAYLYEGIHLRANNSYLSLFGLMDQSDLDGTTLLDLASPKDHPALKRLLRKISDNNANGQIRLHFISQDRGEFEALVNFSPAIINTERCTQVNLVDLSAAKERDLKINLVSTQDQNTGLSSQRTFVLQLNELMPSIHKGRKGTLFYIQLNGINTFRDALGEPAVQGFFSEVATIIKDIEPEAALLSRLSIQSFGLFSFRHDPGANARLADLLCEQIKHICASVPLADDLKPSCNIGLCYADSRSENAEYLLEQAAKAAETAQAQGANIWRTHGETIENPEALADIQQHKAMLNILDAALSEDRFQLFYQPLISLRGDSREHYSVLVRMLNQDNVSFLPQAFFECAKEHGRMAAIDRWVIKHAIEALAKQRKTQRRLNLFIQLASDSIKDEDLLLWICDCLYQFDAKGSWLTFQITDHDVRTNATKARDLIKGLKRISSRVCISHFGLSAKSHTLLEHLPLDYIKLAPNITQEFGKQNGQEQDLVQILQLSQIHQVPVIFGELEHEQHISRLWQLNIHYLQGYLLQAPASALGDEFEIA
jgi:EAL domain-containing protein (putative c-di-GMP-specific phosphodiesterase class I)/GGDEF domain-containing protein/PAS domain-containing protein